MIEQTQLHRDVRLRCHDQRRLRSPAVTRAFASVIRTSSLGAQSEASSPVELILESDVDPPDLAVARDVD